MNRPSSSPAEKKKPTQTEMERELRPPDGFVKVRPPARCSDCGGKFDYLNRYVRTCLGCTPDEFLP